MPIVKYKRSDRPEATEIVTASFESATAAVISRHHPLKERAMLYVLASFLAFILVFISVFQLDRVVTATGRVVPIGGALTVQPIQKAIISRVLVSVGETVKKGQVLATCDPTFVQADFSALQDKVASLEAQKRRWEAEEASQPFHANPTNPYDQLQQTLWQKQTSEFSAGLADLDQRIHSTESQIAGFRSSIQDLERRLKIARETEDMYTRMEKAGVATHLDLIGIQDKTLEMSNMLSTQRSDLTVAEHTLGAFWEQRKVFVEKWHDDNLSKLTEVRDQFDQAVSELTKAKKMNEMVNLTSPVDAVVLTVPQLSTGGIATDAEPLFSLMPLNTPLEIDAQVDAQDSGFVKPGDLVTIKFATYKFLEHGTGEGIVRTISEDAFTEDAKQDAITRNGATSETRSPYFDARIKITGLHLHDVPTNARLVPGMTLDASIIVGKRTILWYLLSGALRSGAEAMHEP